MIRILIADSYAIVRIGLKQILLKGFPSAHIEEAGDAETLVKKVMSGRWDVVICDLDMPGRSGLDALRQLKQIIPQVPMLMTSMYPADHYGVRVLKAGAAGFLGKDRIHEEAIQAIQIVKQGKKFITPLLAQRLLEAMNLGDGHHSHALLSDREFDIFKLLASGITVSEIAAKLSLSVTTVSTYRTRILKKLHLSSNSDLTRYALEKKLI